MLEVTMTDVVSNALSMSSPVGKAVGAAEELALAGATGVAVALPLSWVQGFGDGLRDNGGSVRI